MLAPAHNAVNAESTNQAGSRIEVIDLAKAFPTADGQIVALNGLTTIVEPGEFVSILGPSGCGKSTLMALVAGLDRPTRGEVRVAGRRVDGPVLEAGIVFQRDLLLDWRNCLNNILLQFEMRGRDPASARDHARQLLAMVGMEQFADSYPRQLSGGMRQRVAICRALVHEPPLLCLDEPFGALDALTREELNVELARLSAQTGATVLFVTHSIDEAVFLGDRVLVMSNRPARVVGDYRIDLPRPRDLSVRVDPKFNQYVAEMRETLAAHGAYGGHR